MNIYVELNKIIEYIEKHLEEKIEPQEIAKMVGMSEYTFQRIFSIISNVSISEYIRNRRLSNAGQELYLGQEKIVDIAIKYQYNNATSFSRAFEKFHGIKPSEVRKNPEKLKMYTKLHFNEQYECNKNIDYKIVEKEEITLYGENIITTNMEIRKVAPKFYKEHENKYGEPPYGMVEYYDKERRFVKAYWVMYDKAITREMKKVVIPKSRWIQIKINSQKPEEIQNTSEIFYKEFLPNSKYNFRDLPELEYYHDNVTDFLIPIED